MSQTSAEHDVVDGPLELRIGFIPSSNPNPNGPGGPSGHDDVVAGRVFREIDLNMNMNHLRPHPVPEAQGPINGDGVVEINMDLQNQIDDDVDSLKKDLSFSPFYHVVKHTRNLRRAEVFAFGCINLIVISIILLAQLGMNALGYLPHPIEKANPSNHTPKTFSWKLLSEFFIPESLSNLDKECLYFNKKRFMFPNDGGSDIVYSSKKINDEIRRVNLELHIQSQRQHNGSGESEEIMLHPMRCTFSKMKDLWAWLSRYLSTMILSIVNIICSLIFLLSLSCRRKRGLQFVLIIPSFLCFFLDIFQQIPLTFHYNYASMVLMEEMQNAVAMTVPPYIMSPIWEETQIHGKCCGVNSASSWAIPDFDAYPRSCCDTSKFRCAELSFPTRNQIWSRGCFQQEYDNIRNFEMYALLLLLLKLVSEIGIFWSLSDLTRYNYPAEENVHNSTCNINDFEVKAKGCVTIVGVTEYQKMALKVRGATKQLVRYRVDRVGQDQTVLIRRNDKLLGSIEIHRHVRLDNRNGELPVVSFARVRKQGLIFVTFSRTNGPLL